MKIIQYQGSDTAQLGAEIKPDLLGNAYGLKVTVKNTWDD